MPCPRPGAAADPLSAVTVSADVAAKPTIEFDKPFAVKKTADKVVAAGSGDVLATGQTIVFDYVLVDGRTGKELQTSFGQTPASLVLDTKKTMTQLVNSLKGETVGSRVLLAIAPKDGLAERTQRQGRQEERHAAVRDRREVGAHAAGHVPPAKRSRPSTACPAVTLADERQADDHDPHGCRRPDRRSCRRC